MRKPGSQELKNTISLPSVLQVVEVQANSNVRMTYSEQRGILRTILAQRCRDAKEDPGKSTNLLEGTAQPGICAVGVKLYPFVIFAS